MARVPLDAAADVIPEHVAADAKGGDHADPRDHHPAGRHLVTIIPTGCTPLRPRAPLLAWLGGGCFVASLAYFAWTYLRAVRPRPARRPAASRRSWSTWRCLAASPFTTACSRAAARSGGSLATCRLIWSAPSTSGSPACCSSRCARWWRDVPGEALSSRRATRPLPHWIAVALGAWLTARSAGVIDPLDLAGIRQAGGASAPPRFRVVGPYRWVRHPIYLGWLLLVFGVPHMTATRLAFAAISSAYLVVAIPFEERSLVETFRRRVSTLSAGRAMAVDPRRLVAARRRNIRRLRDFRDSWTRATRATRGKPRQCDKDGREDEAICSRALILTPVLVTRPAASRPVSLGCAMSRPPPVTRASHASA